MNHTELLNKLYYIDKNFDGANQLLYKKAKDIDPTITLKTVKEWLAKQQTTQLVNDRKPGAKNIYLPIYSELPYSFQIDLTFFPKYTQQNNGYNVLFTAININTRFVYAYPAKSKDMDTILDIIKKMEEKTIINSFTCDEGGEFNNKKFIKFCNDNNIIVYFIKDDSHKLGIINRFHRTLKEKLTKYFIANNTVKWYHVINVIVHNYNRSINRGIGIEPINVNSFIENEIIQEKRNQTGIIKENEPEFAVGDSVILKNKMYYFKIK
jgi:Tfp pilus assembly major pilin PilA